MTEQDQKQLGKTLWNIADQLRGAMNADDFRDYMLSFLFLRYLSDNYEQAAQKELGADYPKTDIAAASGDAKPPLARWYGQNSADVAEFEKQMRRKVHYVIKPDYLWGSIVHLARTQSGQLLDTLQKGFKYIEEESFQSNFQGLFSRSTWRPTSWAASTRSATPSCARSSRSWRAGCRCFPRTPIRWAMPTSI
jgi:type I restriction enzyme M protein